MKIKGPEVDPETKRREEQAAARAEASRERETKGRLSDDTDELLRVFGARAFSSLFGGLQGNFVNPGMRGGSGGGSVTGGNEMLNSIAQALTRSLSGGLGSGTATQSGGKSPTGGAGLVP